MEESKGISTENLFFINQSVGHFLSVCGLFWTFPLKVEMTTTIPLMDGKASSIVNNKILPLLNGLIIVTILVTHC